MVKREGLELVLGGRDVNPPVQAFGVDPGDLHPDPFDLRRDRPTSSQTRRATTSQQERRCRQHEPGHGGNGFRLDLHGRRHRSRPRVASPRGRPVATTWKSSSLPMFGRLDTLWVPVPGFRAAGRTGAGRPPWAPTRPRHTRRHRQLDVLAGVSGGGDIFDRVLDVPVHRQLGDDFLRLLPCGRLRRGSQRVSSRARRISPPPGCHGHHGHGGRRGALAHAPAGPATAGAAGPGIGRDLLHVPRMGQRRARDNQRTDFFVPTGLGRPRGVASQRPLRCLERQ